MLKRIEKSKDGQLKMLESIAVLIVFFFLVGIGLKFYGNMSLQSLQEAKEQFAKSDAAKISQKVSHLPELRCTLKNTDQGSCIDLYQALSWVKLSSNVNCPDTITGDSSPPLDPSVGELLCSKRVGHYFEQIGYGVITLERVYSGDPLTKVMGTSGHPVQGDLYVLYNFKLPDEEIKKKQISSSSTRIPVIIYDSITKVRDFGVLNVTVYQ